MKRLFKAPFKNPARERSIVIVEIGNDWLKVIEYEPSTLAGCITKLNFTKLALIKESITSAISKIFSNFKFNKKYVIISIPRHLTTVRILELPSTSPKEISDMVNLQIGKQTPYAKEEIASAYKMLGSDKEDYTKIVLAIARRSIINERVEALRKAGVEAQKVAVSTEGAYNWFITAYMPKLKLEDSEAVALIDVDSNYSDFIIINRRRLVFTRSLLIGANHLLGEPEKWNDKFMDELKYSIELYQGKEKEIKITKIFLSGAGPNIKGLEQLLTTHLAMPVEIADLLKSVVLRKGADIMQDESFKSISISSLVGMASAHKELALDLTLSEMRIQKLMEEKRKQLTITGILVASIAMLASLLFLINTYNKNVYLEQLNQKISKIKEESTEVEKMRLRINLVERRLDAKGTSINMLNEIYKLTPKEIHMNSISIEEKNQAVLKGRASAMSEVFKFITTLEGSPYFKGVKTTYTTTKKEKDAEYSEFEIICAYEKKY